MKVKPVIMAGGLGKRLWPLSLSKYPKQFMKAENGLSLLQNTLIRNKSFGTPTIIVGQEHKFLAAQQIQEIGIKAELMVEPYPRNTLPCAIIAALIAKQSAASKVLLLPSDHHISNEKEYLLTIEKLIEQDQHPLLTIGIKPTFAQPEYGYIKVKNLMPGGVYKVEKYAEKPSLAKAKSYIKEGGYFWNSGIFIYDTNFILRQCRRLQRTAFYQIHASFLKSISNFAFTIMNEEMYHPLPSLSFDKAIIQKIENIIMIEGKFGWHDLGNWGAIWHMSSKDKDNNYLIGNVVTHNVTNSYIRSTNKLTSVIGIDNIIVVNTDNGLLIAHRSSLNKISQLFELNKKLT